MDDKFYETMTLLFEELGIKFPYTDSRQIYVKGNSTHEIVLFTDSIVSFARREPDLSKAPVVPCLIAFAMFDCQVEEKFAFPAGNNFIDRYRNITVDSSRPLTTIVKGCYRLIRLIRNCFVHNMSGVRNENGEFVFAHGRKHLRISGEMLNLLYYIIFLTVRGKYAVPTAGHFEAAIITYYDKLEKYISAHGNFRDESTEALPVVNAPFFLKTCARLRVENTTWLIRFAPVGGSASDKIQITTEYKAHEKSKYYSDYGTDYKIDCGGKTYIIPLEALDDENSIPLNNLNIWTKL